MPLQCPPLHHCPRTPSSSDVPSHRLNLHRPSPPRQDHPPRPPNPPYCQHQPPLKTIAWHRHIDSIPSPIWLATQVSQQFRKPQVPSPPRSSLLSRQWVDLRRDYFLTHSETSPKTSSSPIHLEPHQPTPSSSFLNCLPLPPPPNHLSCLLLPSPPQYWSPCSSIFSIWEGKLEKKQYILRWSWWVERIISKIILSLWLPFCVFWENNDQNTRNRTAYWFTCYLRLAIPFAN